MANFDRAQLPLPSSSLCGCGQNRKRHVVTATGRVNESTQGLTPMVRSIRAHTRMLPDTFAMREAQRGGVARRRFIAAGAPQDQDHREPLSKVRPATAGTARASGDGARRSGPDAATSRSAPSTSMASKESPRACPVREDLYVAVEDVSSGCESDARTNEIGGVGTLPDDGLLANRHQ
jgi:hypothetical protein